MNPPSIFKYSTENTKRASASSLPGGLSAAGAAGSCSSLALAPALANYKGALGPLKVCPGCPGLTRRCDHPFHYRSLHCPSYPFFVYDFWGNGPSPAEDSPGGALCPYASPSNNFSDTPALPFDTFSDTSIEKTVLEKVKERPRIVGLESLMELLNPSHPYFEDKGGYLQDPYEYKHSKDDKYGLYFPRVSVRDKKNPYYRHRLSRGHSSRTYDLLKLLAERYEVPLGVVEVVVTVPKEVSVYLSGLSASFQGEKLFRGLMKKVWGLYQGLEEDSSGQASRMNVHPWSSRNPLEPHWHAHFLVLDHRLVKSPDGKCDLVRKRWGLNEKKKRVPMGVDLLDLFKREVTKLVIAFARGQGVDVPSLVDDGKLVDIHVNYIPSIDSGFGRSKLLHKLGYVSRHYLEDFAKYTNEYIVWEDPPEWLTEYPNRSIPLGWWRRIKSLIEATGINVDEWRKERRASKVKASPVNGEDMVFVGKASLRDVLRLPNLGYFGYERGVIFLGRVTDKQRAWLLANSWFTSVMPHSGAP